ncbi:glycosyltransferase [Seonamhaeicola sp. NFXS20]|uniref:glycosyltransferase family 2 protein n=1 Tax=Seonamhaeicola sp. NFXS20 TaxID=2816959 RepID=UPI003B8E759D
MAFFSVIIPLFNKENFIEDTLNSVLNQTFTDFEVIIVNDGSTDNSISKINAIKDSRVNIFSQKNSGASAARNKGIELAKGSLIAFLDADDLWLPNHLKVLANLFNDFTNCGLYCSRYKTKISRKKIIENDLTNCIEDNYRGIVSDFFKASLKNRIAHTSALAIPKHILDEYGVFDVNISSGQDLDLWIRIAAHCNVAISNEITSIYRFEIQESLSKTNILSKKLIDFKKFEALEKTNKSLKIFLDHYRLEYALHYRVSGSISKSGELLKEITSDISLKSKILLKLPPKLLQVLLKVKHYLRKKGIDFTIYH